jgi:hypothetical protein
LAVDAESSFHQVVAVVAYSRLSCLAGSFDSPLCHSFALDVVSVVELLKQAWACVFAAVVDSWKRASLERPCLVALAVVVADWRQLSVVVVVVGQEWALAWF